MTKEELEKEAEEFLQKKWGTSKMLILGGDAREVLADFAESREKQIQIDAKQIRALQKQNGELTDKVKELESELHRVSLNEQLAINNGRNFLKQIAELEAQIEEMKCCGNCAKYNSGYGENPCKMGASMICGEWETFIGKF